jgi:hypothetical protein
MDAALQKQSATFPKQERTVHEVLRHVIGSDGNWHHPKSAASLAWPGAGPWPEWPESDAGPSGANPPMWGRDPASVRHGHGHGFKVRIRYLKGTTILIENEAPHEIVAPSSKIGGSIRRTCYSSPYHYHRADSAEAAIVGRRLYISPPNTCDRPRPEYLKSRSRQHHMVNLRVHGQCNLVFGKARLSLSMVI